MQTQPASPAIFTLEPGVFKVSSSRNPRVKHTVRANPDGSLKCGCEWGSSPIGYARTGKPCRHMLAIQESGMMETKPEPTFIPVSDPAFFDEDPFGDMPSVHIVNISAYVQRPNGSAQEAPHKPSMAELVDFFCN